MAERATVTQGVYIGAETSPGDGGADFKVLDSFDLTPGVKVDMQRFRPQGRKLESIIVPGKEWTEFKLDGMAEYHELHYLLSGIFGKNQVTQPSAIDGTGKLWKYILSAQARDDVQTFGMVKGDSDKAEAYSYVLMTELSFDLSREGVKLDGTAIGHEADFAGSLPHPFDDSGVEVPVLPTDISVYLDSSEANLGDTKLARAFQVKTTIGDRHNPVWVLDRDEKSFLTHVELAPKFEFEVTLEANSQGTDILEDLMRGGETAFLRVEAISEQVAGASTEPYSFVTDAAVKVADVGEFEDQDGVYALKYTFAAVYDNTDDFSVETSLVNKAAGF